MNVMSVCNNIAILRWIFCLVNNPKRLTSFFIFSKSAHLSYSANITTESIVYITKFLRGSRFNGCLNIQKECLYGRTKQCSCIEDVLVLLLLLLTRFFSYSNLASFADRTGFTDSVLLKRSIKIWFCAIPMVIFLVLESPTSQ